MNQADEITYQLTQVTEKEVKQLIIDITQDLKNQTPILTGWARSNWIPSLDQPANGPVGTRQSVSYDEQTRGLLEIEDYTLDRQAHIINDVPYIGLLNEGYSRQAPAGFVDAVIERVVTNYNGKVL